MSLPFTFNWIATGLCAVLSAKGAVIIGSKSSHIFAVLALFSLCWALLLPYYGSAIPAELFSGFSGFVLICVGLLLVRGSQNTATTKPKGAVVAASQAGDHAVAIAGSPQASSLASGLTSSTTVVQPEQMATPLSAGPDRDWLRDWLTGYGPVVISGRAALALLLLLITALLKLQSVPKTTLVIATALELIGYFSVCKGIHLYSGGGREWRYIARIAIPYAAADVVYTFYGLLEHAPRAMPAFFLIVFGILKLLFCAMFVYLIAKRHVIRAGEHQGITDVLHLSWQIVLVLLLWDHSVPIPADQP